MKQISLTQGQFALVDDKDFEWLNQYKWHAIKERNTFYAKRNVKTNGKYGIVPMHREILKLKDSNIHTDHKDRNGLNNQRSNIRKCTNAQNQANRKSGLNSSSKYLGVSFNKRTGKWVTLLGKNKKLHHLGYFINEIDAAKAYNKAAKKHHREFARLNVI